jgi:hypothetical protein
VTNHQLIAAVIARLETPVFLARSVPQRRGLLISLHTSDRSASRRLSRRAAEALRVAGIDADCRMIKSKHRHFRQKSLEAMVDCFGSGDIVYDPTGLVSRTTAVLSLARRLRRDTTVALKGVFLNPDRRALFVVVDQKTFPAATDALLKKRVEAMGEIARTVQAWRRDEASSVELAIRIGYELPASVAVIPVDRASVPSPMGVWQRRGIAAALGSLLGFGALAPVQAADIVRPPPVAAPVVVAPAKEPAVAHPNLDLLFAGLYLNGDGFDNFSLAAVGGKAALPLGQSFGLQVDAAVGTSSYWGVGGHLFWRDPSQALLGLIASYESLNGAVFDRYGGEAELYLRNVTLRGEVGAQGGDAPHTLFAGLDLTFYAHPNLALTAGANRENAEWRGHAGLEWQPQGLAGLSLFADGDFGANNFVKAVAGVSIHFGSPGVTLIDRDRKYDPQFSLFHFAPQTTSTGYSPPPA